MHITILNGDPDPASEFQSYLHTVAQRLKASGPVVATLDLRELDLKNCAGCFVLVKTPGECVQRGDNVKLCRAAIEADLLLLASPIIMGFTTALLKRAADHMIALIHPYFVVEDGEVHHRSRYAHYPRFALLLCAGGDSDSEDIEITTAMWKRMARNMKSRMVIAAATNRSAEEVANEIALVA